jgi:hypothetical protein
MQNKPNLPNAQMNVNTVMTKDYENKSNWTLGENKAKTNPRNKLQITGLNDKENPQGGTLGAKY